MIQKKICLLGAPGVGKTSLARRFTESIFGTGYHSTIGIAMSKKVVEVGDRNVSLAIWDLAGEIEAERLPAAYLRGASGYLVVVDATRRSTLETGLDLSRRARETLGEVPAHLVVNKIDLGERWDHPHAEGDVCAAGLTLVKTSARTGAGVDEAFRTLAVRMLG